MCFSRLIESFLLFLFLMGKGNPSEVAEAGGDEGWSTAFREATHRMHTEPLSHQA